MTPKLLAISGIFLLAALSSGCQKECVKPTPSTGPTTIHRPTSRTTLTETETLIRAWTEWVFTRDINLLPWEDATGAKQYAGQPYTSGTMMLAGGGSPDLVNRALTININQYQQVFIPLVNSFSYWNDCYYAHPSGNVPTGIVSGLVTQSLNGQRALTLKWDGVSLLPAKLKDLRANSDTGVATMHPSWIEGCTAGPTTFYDDGFWAKLPLALGVHTLEVAGDSEFKIFKSPFSNHVIYTITVTN